MPASQQEITLDSDGYVSATSIEHDYAADKDIYSDYNGAPFTHMLHSKMKSDWVNTYLQMLIAYIIQNQKMSS